MKWIGIFILLTLVCSGTMYAQAIMPYSTTATQTNGSAIPNATVTVCLHVQPPTSPCTGTLATLYLNSAHMALTNPFLGDSQGNVNFWAAPNVTYDISIAAPGLPTYTYTYTIGTLSAQPSDAIQYVSTNGNDSNDGLSMGTAKATVASAYAALPSTGGAIYIAATNGCLQFSSGLLFNTSGKPVFLKGQGSQVSCLQYTGSSGTAIILDATGSNGIASKLEDFELRTTVIGSMVTGISVGPTNNCGQCQVNNVLVDGFQIEGLSQSYRVAWSNDQFEQCSSAPSSVGFQTGGSGDDTNIAGGRVENCVTLINNASTSGPLWISNLVLASTVSVTTAFISNPANAILFCSQCHWFNGIGGLATNWFTNAGTFFLSNSQFESARNGGGITSAATSTGGQLVLSNIRINHYGTETASEFVLLSGSSTINFSNITNQNPSDVLTLWANSGTGGAQGSLGLSILTKSSAYTLTASDSWINVTGTTTITVPHALTGQRWDVFNSGAGTVTLAPDSGNICTGGSCAATKTVAVDTGVSVTCDGTNCFAH